MVKSMRPDNPNNEKEMLWLILFGNTPPNPRTTKLTPRIITSHRPILSTVLDEYFKLGVVITSLEGLIPNNCSICLLNIPAKIVNVPRINQKANIVSLPFLLVLVRLTVCVTRGWAGGDHATLMEPVSGQVYCLKTRTLPPVGCTLCWAALNIKRELLVHSNLDPHFLFGIASKLCKIHLPGAYFVQLN